MMRSAVLAVTDRGFTKRMITDTRAGRALVTRFVAGSELSDAVDVAKTLNHHGLLVSLDYLGEHITDITEADRAVEAYVACARAIAAEGLDANISIKLTQLGMGLDDDVAAGHLDTIATAAAEAATTVTVDMEESTHTAVTIDLYEDAQRRHGNLGIAIQAYLRRSPSDIERLGTLGGHIRLCKGAYAEPDDIAFQGKAVDHAYDRLASVLMATTSVKPAIATHDDARIDHVLGQSGDRTSPWEFQMLYGIRRDRQAELARAGHAMRIYVPFGEAWYPYLTRRMAERPANLAFFLRAVVGK